MLQARPHNVRYFSLSIRAETPCEKAISKIVSGFRSSLRDLCKEHHSTALVLIQSINVFSAVDGPPRKRESWSYGNLSVRKISRNTSHSQGTEQISIREYEEMGCLVEVKEFAQRVSRSDQKEFR